MKLRLVALVMCLFSTTIFANDFFVNRIFNVHQKSINTISREISSVNSGESCIYMSEGNISNLCYSSEDNCYRRLEFWKASPGFTQAYCSSTI